MRSERSLIGLGVRNPVMANLSMVCILVGGAWSAWGMVRETFPAFSVDHIGIDVIYPGASPQDVETGIVIKIEEALSGISGVSELSSSSSEGGCTVFARLDTDVDDPARVLKEIQDRVERITTLPVGAEDPVVSERLIRNQVVNIAVSGDTSERTLKLLAERVRDDLIANPAISQISMVGVRDYEISIEVSEEALRRYSLSFNQVIAAVKASSLDLPAGVLRTKDEEIILRTAGQRYTSAEFEQLVVISAPDGTLVRLGQIATVRDTFEETAKRGWFNGLPGVMIGIYKTESEDTSIIARTVRDYAHSHQADLPQGVSMNVWADASRDVDGRINLLVDNGVVGIGLVLLALTLFLNVRLSIWVAAGIPVSFAGALIILGATDQTLNMISLLGLIMATGIIVDDAIVIAEHIHTLRATGLDAKAAAIQGGKEMALPVLGSSATTVLAFAPLLYVSGVMGKFIMVLPIAVIAAIGASAFEAFVILPAHLRHADQTVRGHQWRSRLRSRLDGGFVWILDHVYRPALCWAVRRRGLTLALAMGGLLLAVGLIGGGRVPFVLFPKGETNLLRARVRFPEGTTLSTSEQVLRRLEKAALALNQLPEDQTGSEEGPVLQVFSNVGEWSGFWTENGTHLCEVTVELAPAETRTVRGSELLDLWRKATGNLHDALSVDMVQQELGPTAKPLEIRLHSDDLDVLARASDEVAAHLASYSGVSEIDSDLIPGKRELRVSLKPVARTLGLTVSDLASQLREGFFGGEAVRLLRGLEEVKVQVRYPASQRHNLADVERMRIRTHSGQEIPFSEAAQVEMVRGYSSIWRQDGHRRVRVRANVNERIANAEAVLQNMTATFLPELEERLRREFPEARFTYSLGGQRAQMNESMGSLARGFSMALVAIFAILASIMRSYTQPVLIMLAIPLGLVGAIAGHMVMGYDITIMSVFGAVALSGVVVNDALVLIVQINRIVRRGKPIVEAVVEAGTSRLRAVVLTTITTIVGLGPLLFERATQAQQLIPMVISLCFGLLFATVLTLLVVPAMYLIVNDVRRFVSWLWRGGEYPSAEDVEEREPASSAPSML